MTDTEIIELLNNKEIIAFLNKYNNYKCDIFEDLQKDPDKLSYRSLYNLENLWIKLSELIKDDFLNKDIYIKLMTIIDIKLCDGFNYKIIKSNSNCFGLFKKPYYHNLYWDGSIRRYNKFNRSFNKIYFI